MLLTIRRILSPGNMDVIQETLIKTKTWEERVVAMTDSIEANDEQRSKYSKTYVRQLCEAMLVSLISNSIDDQLLITV